MSKFSLKLKPSSFSDFVNKLQDLSQIDDTIKIKLESEKTLIYSMISNDVSVLALKSYTLNTKDYFENFTKEETVDFIITSSGKFVKNLKFFNTEKSIKLDLVCKPMPENNSILQVRSAQFSNEKLKISCIGGEQYKIRDINLNVLSTRLNPKLSKWAFKISRTDFSDVKKLSSINSEEKTLYINVSSNKVTMSEPSKWELEIDEINHKNEQLIFNKKYLSNINDNNEIIYFTIFESFILIKDEISNLMLSFETNFDTEN
jgi:hypothetical protein